MLKILVLSDLHLEFGRFFSVPPGLEYDAVVLAGDIHCPGHRAVTWAQGDSTFGGRPVVIVPGNHEFYGREMDAELAEMKKAASGSNVHVLDRSEVVVAGVRFLGCVLWTNFELPVQGLQGPKTDVRRALAEANGCMNDFRLIRVQAAAGSRRVLTAQDAVAMHSRDREWLQRELTKDFAGPTVVITHHAPALGSVAEQYAASWLTPSFVSLLPPELFERTGLWIHGHTHSRFDYQHHGCRVLSNPRGYQLRDGAFENHRFDPGLVVEVTTQVRTQAGCDDH